MQRGTRLALAAAFLLLTALAARADVVINEIMYNSSFDPDIEFVELYNTGPGDVNLYDWYLLDSNLGHPRCYLEGVLGAGEYLVVAADVDLFTARYPDVTNLNPNGFDPDGNGFGLGNGGDTVNLFDDDDVLRDQVVYDDGGEWPSSPDGDGPSLELINPLLDNAVPSSWDPSSVVGGTPGAVNSTYAADAAPICRDGSRDIRLPTATDAVTVTVLAFDAEGPVTVELMVDLGSGYVSQPMYDDGLHGDGAAADSVFGSVIPPQPDGTVVRYYAVATDGVGQTDTWPGDAPAEYRAYTVGHTVPPLVINEILANNATGITDEMGEAEDWIEIRNIGPEPLDLGGMYLSDDSGDRHKWMIPGGTVVGPGEFLVVWADNDPEQGPLHATFKLSSGGEEAILYDTEDAGNARIHGFKFGPCGPDEAVGFLPDLGAAANAKTQNYDHGWAPEYLATPTPGAPNAGTAPYSAVCINEFHTTSAAGGVDDWVELYNRGTAAVAIGGCFLSDNRTENTKYRIPDGTVVPAGGFLVFDEETLGFSFTSSGEVIVFTAPDSVTGLDFYDFGEQTADVSEGRTPDGAGRWAFFTSPTPGAPNGTPTAADRAPAVVPLLADVAVAPNPFNPATTVRFDLSRPAPVRVSVYDLAGRLLRRLHDGELDAGSHVLRWDGRDDAGRAAAAGTVLLRIEAPGERRAVKLMLVK